MTTPDFRPIAYMKDGCPWCLKFRLFLLEAGLLGQFDLREFVPGDAREEAIRAELGAHFEKPTFPTVQIAPGEFMRESDDLIAHYAAQFGVDVGHLLVFDQYVRGPIARMAQLRAEIAQLKAG
jgi:hypothetical protein